MPTPAQKSKTSAKQQLIFVILNATVQDYSSFVVISAGSNFPNKEHLLKEESSVQTACLVNITLKHLSICSSPDTHSKLPARGSRRQLPAQFTYTRQQTSNHGRAKVCVIEGGEVAEPDSSCPASVCVLTGSSWERSCGYCNVNRSLCKSVTLGESLCDMWELRQVKNRKYTPTIKQGFNQKHSW